MKKISIVVAAAAIIATGALSSCNGNKTKQNDSLQAIEEMVSTVEEATATTDTAKYNAAFFNDASKLASTPSDSTYMVTETGLKYAVVKEGNGKKPAATDAVTVHYTGKLTDGTVFDSSVSRGEPATFPLNRVIPGWTEGLQLMKEGGTTVFYIPSKLAYGEQGAPGAIPPNSDLIFEVQLISVKLMNISSYYSAKPRIAVALMAVAVLLLSLSACKGRRATDMTPSEDTVEAVINEPVETDSIVATDSLSEAGNPNI